MDEVIETTQKQIDKLQDLKKATMNELLTKGIGHTEFKDSVLGRIPKSWEVVSVMDSNITLLDGDRGNEYPKGEGFYKIWILSVLIGKKCNQKWVQIR